MKTKAADNYSKKIILSVVVVNYNGYKYVVKCIESILKSSFKGSEIVIVDNGSSDDVRLLKRKFGSIIGKKIKIVSLNKNFGPAYARNEGVRVSNGEYIGFLDNDTIVDKNWASEAIKIFKSDGKIGAIQCKLLLKNKKRSIDYVGEYIGQNGFLVQRAGTGELDNGQYDQIVEILAAKSAGMFITRKAFAKAGGFDPDYFIYVEETDLGWRTWLAGFKIVFSPLSVVYHEFGTSTIILGKSKNEYNSKFHGVKNYILTLIKNLDTPNLLRILPTHIMLWLGLAWYTLFRGSWNAFIYIHFGVIWNMIHLRRSLHKRMYVQTNRKITDSVLLNKIMKKRNIWYFISKVVNRKKVGNAESF